MKDLSVGNERKLILHFATPMLLGNIFQQLYNVVDSVIVGNYIGKEALAAVGASFPILFTLISLILGIAIGSTIIIAQYFGAKNMDRVKLTIDTLYNFLVIASIVTSLVGIYFSTDIFRLIKLPEDVIPQAELYFDIYIAGVILFFMFNGTSAVLRGLGDSKTPLYFMILSTLLNIGLDFMFVVWFGWGIEGVAVATLVAQGAAFISLVIYLNKTHDVIRLTFRRYKFDREIFFKGVKIGFPIGFQQAFVAVSMMAMYWLVNRFGTNVTAAYSVVFRIDSFAAMPAMNFANALSTFVGQNLGANRPERVRKGLLATFKMTSIIAITITLVAFVFSEPLMRLFTSDREVIEIGVSYLKIVSFFYITFSTMFVVGGVMRGAGDTFVPMIITFFALWVVRIPVCYFLSEKFGYIGLWWGIPVAWIIGMTFSYFYYLTGRWRKKAVVKYETRDAERGTQDE
jgi:putative MATE family efflux protein